MIFIWPKVAIFDFYAYFYNRIFYLRSFGSEQKLEKILLSTPKAAGQETNVKLYHKLIDGWAVEIIEV